MKNPRRNNYIASICRSIGEAAALRAVAKYVDQYRRPGMTLEDIGRALGVSAIVREKLPFDGGVFSEGTELTIKINSSSIPTRQRFTLAHELGHLIISAGSTRSARRCLKSNPLEEACDCVAAELLMPMDQVRTFVEKPASMRALLSFANRFNVSINAAAVRINELKVWKESIGLWKWDGGAKQLWYVGKRFWSDKQLPSGAFEEAMRSTSSLTTDALCSDSRGTRSVDIRVQRLGRDYILGLIGP
jgi:Zn-dependent peptidase ImmA (M78 family)